MITITGKVRKAIAMKSLSRVPRVNERVTWTLNAPYGDADGNTVAVDSSDYQILLNGTISGIYAPQPDTGETAVFTATLPDNTAFDVTIDDNDTTIALETALMGATPDSESTIQLTGTVTRQSGKVWANGEVVVKLIEAFATTAAIYPKQTFPIRVGIDGKINGNTGLTLVVPSGSLSTWAITLPDGTEISPIYLSGDMESVDLADIVNGDFVFSFSILSDEDSDTLTDELGNELIGSY